MIPITPKISVGNPTIMSLYLAISVLELMANLCPMLIQLYNTKAVMFIYYLAYFSIKISRLSY